MEELRRRCFECLSEALQHGTVRPGELEGAVWEYYRKTAPSLQEFYSRYTPEWEVFYEHEQLLPSDFLDFLYRMQSAFRKRYALAELDVPYYIERLERLPLLSPERKRLQELFLDKWHRLLTNKEYDYQYHHIESLCEGFALLDKQNGLKTVADVTGSRVRWLLLNRPELYRRIVPYEKVMEQNRHIRELVRVLGKHSKGEKRSFDPLGGIREEQLVRHAVRSDIEGVTLGNDLNHLLPMEYCYLTDEALRPVFMQKFVEKRLQVFDSRSAEDSSTLQKGRKPVSGQGPFVVCLDTSGSMQGKRETLAKSALLAVAKLVDSTHRKCYVINFAEDIHCMLIKDLRTDLPLLADFLNYRFDGGTDMAPAQDLGTTPLKSFGAGSGFLGIPGDVTPPSRFVRAAFYQSTAPQQDTAEKTVLQGFQILNNFDIPVGIEFPLGKVPVDIPSATQWTSATDMANRTIYYRTMYNSAIRSIDLRTIDFAKVKYQAIPLDNVTQQPIQQIKVSPSPKSGRK